MGNNTPKLGLQSKFKGFLHKFKTASTKVGEQTVCPNCGVLFSRNSTYETVNNHVQTCLTTQQPLPQIQTIQQIQIYSLKKGQNSKIWIKQLYKCSSQLLDFSFSQIKIRSFGQRLFWYQSKLSELKISWKQGCEQIIFRNTNAVQDSIGVISDINLRRQLKLSVINDKVQDAGGLLRQWCSLVIGSLLEDYCLCVATGKQTVNPYYKLRELNKQQLQNMHDLYTMLGAILGKVLLEKVTIQYHFDFTFLRMLLGQPVTLEDVQTYDKQLYHSWKFIQQASQKQLQQMQLYFTVFKNGINYQLFPNGSNLLVNLNNRKFFIQKCIQHYCVEPYRYQIEFITQKLSQIIHIDLLNVFNPEELSIILNGIDHINIEDWKSATIYKEVYHQNHKVILWFWQIVQSLTQQQMMKLLKFVTGSSRLPVTGFKKLETNRGKTSPFIIESIKYDKIKPYPTAHTCFNRLVLPLYPNQNTLELYLVSAINSNFQGSWGLQ